MYGVEVSGFGQTSRYGATVLQWQSMSCTCGCPPRPFNQSVNYASPFHKRETGTGKSSLVCALCIGLGGSPKGSCAPDALAAPLLLLLVGGQARHRWCGAAASRRSEAQRPAIQASAPRCCSWPLRERGAQGKTQPKYPCKTARGVKRDPATRAAPPSRPTACAPRVSCAPRARPPRRIPDMPLVSRAHI